MIRFFSVNNIEDFRKHYNGHPLVKRIVEELHPPTIEDLDQEFFPRFLSKSFEFPRGIFESKIYGETDVEGLKLDFNFGLRLQVPEGDFRVRVSDFDTGKVCFDGQISGGRLISVENYFIRWHIEVFLRGKKIFEHTLDLEGQPVAIISKTPALGDTLAFFPYLREFQKVHRCKLLFCPFDNVRELVAQLYPDIELIDAIDFQTYATYYSYMAASVPFFPLVPTDVRQMSMTRVGGMLFGIDYLPPKAKFRPTEPPVTDEPYVCIGVQAKTVSKSWLWPNGWDIVIEYLRRLGYRVFCIDREDKAVDGPYTVSKPAGAEDFTGEHSLLERANMLYHAEFFIGLGSGLSWLAYIVDCPVVMICGFSQEWCEFYTPYRVANRKVCNGCFNDIRVFYPNNPCPYQKGTARELECQKEISPRMVINAIERLIVDKNLTPPALKNF